MEGEEEVEIECRHCGVVDTYYVCIDVDFEDYIQDRD